MTSEKKYDRIWISIQIGDMIKIDYNQWFSKDVVNELKSFEENSWLIIQDVCDGYVSFKNQKNEDYYDVSGTILEFKRK